MFRRKDARARRALDAAQRSLEQAAAEHAAQKAKREQEQALISRLDRLAEGNHLAELVLAALTERHHRGTA
jgi:hypothetical protein